MVPDTWLRKSRKNVSISVSNVPGLMRNLKEFFKKPVYSSSSKEPTTLKTIEQSCQCTNTAFQINNPEPTSPTSK